MIYYLKVIMSGAFVIRYPLINAQTGAPDELMRKLVETLEPVPVEKHVLIPRLIIVDILGIQSSE